MRRPTGARPLSYPALAIVTTSALAVLWTATAAEAGHEDGRVLIFAQPFVRADAIWMARLPELAMEIEGPYSQLWKSR
jgi:hypothetical protein